MNRVFRIFRKDARHLWPHVLGLLLLMASAALLDPTFGTGAQSSSYGLLVGFALPLACWFLIIAAIHEEKLSGDRQYWLTRPYWWTELLAAKALFIAVFVNLPLFVWHVAAYALSGVPVREHLPELLWRQAFFTAFYILPVAALAAFTRNLGQLILAAIAVIVPGFLLESFLATQVHGAHRLSGTFTAAIALIIGIGVPVILALQYSRRAARYSRIVAVATILGTLMSPPVTAWLSADAQPRITQSSVRISLDPSPARPSPAAVATSPNDLNFDIPLRFEGVPPGIHLLPDSTTLSVVGAKGIIAGAFHDVTAGTGWLALWIQRYTGAWPRTSPVTLRGSARFMTFANPQLLPLPEGRRAVVVPRVGYCAESRDSLGMIALVCYTPDPRASVMIGTPRLRVNWIVPQGMVESSIPTSSGFQPLTRFTSLLSYRSWDQIGDAQLLVAAPRPQLNLSFELPDVDLARYAAPEP